MAHIPPALDRKREKVASYIKKTTAKGGKHFFLRVGFVLIMLGLIAFSLYQLVQHMTVGLDTLRTQELTDETYVNLKLYVFRDETVITSNGQVYAYHVANGEKVGVGETLATAYQTSEQDPTQIQAKLTSLATQISALQTPIGKDHPSEIDELKDAIDLAYADFLEAVSEGDLQAADAHALKMGQYLGDYEALVGGDKQIANTLTTLQNAQNALLGGMTAVGNIQTDKGGYFYYHTDGYEGVFTAETANTMTPETFLQLASATAQPESVGVVGKMAYTATWYAATYVSLEDVTAFQEGVGDLFSVTTTDGKDITLPMTLVRMEPDANGALLVFKTQALPEGFDIARSFSVVVKTGSNEGYRVPADALVTLNTKHGDILGVYVLESNVVEFRKVMVKARYDDYVLAETYTDVQTLLESLDEAQREAMLADGYAYLNLNDKIITRGTGLYDGKIIG